MTRTISTFKAELVPKVHQVGMSKEFTVQPQNSIHCGERKGTSDNVMGNGNQRAQLQDISKAFLIQVRLIQACGWKLNHATSTIKLN
jgi:hypothetical protein